MAKIVVIDDDKTMGGLMRTLLELEGYQPLIVPTRAEILPTLRRERPDLVLMDVLLSGVETLDLVPEIRHDQDLSGLPIVMTSGLDRGDACLAVGANAFILKPFRPVEVLSVMQELLSPPALTKAPPP